MRGKAANFGSTGRAAGITPAYAGKRVTIFWKGAWGRDHPRVCGEKRVPPLIGLLCTGSPPRMRGKADGRDQDGGASGDHPRVCGEKFRKATRTSTERGSPPRMRGKGLHGVVQELACGITPAYAGKRLKRSHSIGHFSCILCLFHSVLHRASASGGSRAGPCAPPCLTAQNAVPV